MVTLVTISILLYFVPCLNYSLSACNKFRFLTSDYQLLFAHVYLQDAIIDYVMVAKSDIRELERSVQQALTSRLEKLRGRHVTKWNRATSRLFEQVLADLEKQYTGALSRQEDSAAWTEIKKLNTIYYIRGFSLQQPWTDMDALMEAVFSTEVHANYDSNAQFVLAVHCAGYCQNVINVRIYVASMTKIEDK
jgi:coiled-coil and C2 domain-containing protein 2A